MKNSNSQLSNTAKTSVVKKIAVGAALVATPFVASGQMKGCKLNNFGLPEFSKSNIEYHAIPADNDKARVNLFYEVLNTKVYSFVELYDNKGYFNKNMMHIPTEHVFGAKLPGLGIAIDLKFSNVFESKAGIGIEQIMELPLGIYASAKFLPIWFDKEGRRKNEATLGYSISKTVPISNKVDFTMSLFGDFNVAGKKTNAWGYGAAWDYGEIDASVLIKTKAGQFDVGVGFNQIPSSSAIDANVGPFAPTPVEKFWPDNQLRLKVAYHLPTSKFRGGKLIDWHTKDHYDKNRVYVTKKNVFSLD